MNQHYCALLVKLYDMMVASSGTLEVDKVFKRLKVHF